MIISPKGGFNFVSFYQFHNGSFNNHLGIKQYSERIYIERIKKEIKTEWTHHYKTSHTEEISTSVLEEYLIKVDKIKKESSAFYSGQLLFKYLLKARLFHRSPDNIQQLIRYRLLASLIILLGQILNQFIRIIRCHLHSQCTGSMLGCIRIHSGCKNLLAQYFQESNRR